MQVESFERGDAEGSVHVWLSGDCPQASMDLLAVSMPTGVEEFEIQSVLRPWDEEDRMLGVVVAMAWDTDLTLAEADVLDLHPGRGEG